MNKNRKSSSFQKKADYNMTVKSLLRDEIRKITIWQSLE